MSDYTATGKPLSASRGVAKDIRDEFSAIQTANNSKADIASPAFTGVPTAPTAATGTATTQIATTDFVAQTALVTTLPGQAGNGGKYLTTDGASASWASILDSRATVASHATAADIWSDGAQEIDFTGTATVTAFPAAPQAGMVRFLHMADAASFTNGANLILPGGTSYTAKAGDIVTVHAISTTQFRLYVQRNDSTVKLFSILSSGATTHTPVGDLGDVSRNLYGASFGTTPWQLIYGDSLFVACRTDGTTSSVVKTSPDGKTWTNRSLTASRDWRVGFDGTSFLAVSVATTTDCDTSADGITWGAASNNPSTVPTKDEKNNPVSRTTDEWVIWASGTTLYHTTDSAATAWTSQTIPVTNNLKGFFVIGGLYWYWNSGTTAYTSATGLTSSWTSRTLPASPSSVGHIWQNPDSSICIRSSALSVYRTTDGINWTDLSVTTSNTNAHPAYYINGNTYFFSSTAGESKIWYGSSVEYPLGSLLAAFPSGSSENTGAATDGSGTYVFPCNTAGKVIVITNNDKGFFS
jgi:hypothetical protein